MTKNDQMKRNSLNKQIKLVKIKKNSYVLGILLIAL